MPIKRRILCVDDQPDICDLICAVLKDCEVVSAQSKLEGLRKVQGGLFDLYLLDYSLADGTGLELATLIRQFDDSTPILIMTSPHSGTNRQISEVGAQGFVSKDDLPDDLVRKVSRLLNPAENSQSC
jgi:CheY-like chemotaxis protein